DRDHDRLLYRAAMGAERCGCVGTGGKFRVLRGGPHRTAPRRESANALCGRRQDSLCGSLRCASYSRCPASVRMRIAIVTCNARIVGGIESYLDTVIPLLESAGHDIAMLCEFDAPGTSTSISRNTEAPLWIVAQEGAAHSLDSLRRWRPDLIYTHGLADTALEARALEIAPAIAYVHDYRATCISGAKAF